MLARRLTSVFKRSSTSTSSSDKAAAKENGTLGSFGRKAVSFVLITVTGGVALSAFDDLSIYRGCSSLYENSSTCVTKSVFTVKNEVVALEISQIVGLFSKAMEKVMRNKAMIEAIGEPIEKGPWYNASLAVSQQRHSVSCSFPVIGPQGTGILHLKAVRNGGKKFLKRPKLACDDDDDDSYSTSFLVAFLFGFLGTEDSLFGFLQQRDWDILIMDALVHVPSNDGPQQTLRIDISVFAPPSAATDYKSSEPEKPAKS
ncbi:hypothetical protein Bca4012_059093 [Brassica carinata]